MTLVIAVMAVLAVFGSVMWLKPSPAQQRQVRLRTLARQLGMDVRLAALPQIRRARVREEEAEQGVVYRLLRFDLAAPLAQDYVLVRQNAESGWESQSDQVLPRVVQRVLNEESARVPKDVVAIELTAHGPGVYWREHGDEQTLKDIFALMERLLEAMSAR